MGTYLLGSSDAAASGYDQNQGKQCRKCLSPSGSFALVHDGFTSFKNCLNRKTTAPGGTAAVQGLDIILTVTIIADMDLRDKSRTVPMLCQKINLLQLNTTIDCNNIRCNI